MSNPTKIKSLPRGKSDFKDMEMNIYQQRKKPLKRKIKRDKKKEDLLNVN